MIPYLIVLTVGFATAVILVPAARTIARRVGALDLPSELSIHPRPVPRIGGLAMFVAFLAAVLCATYTIGVPEDQDRARLVALLVAGALAGLAGLLGDVNLIPSRVEISLVLIPAALVILTGVRVRFIPSALLSVPVTFFYLVGGSAALNLLDGMDGLAAGVTAISAGCFSVLSLSQGNGLGVIISLALLGASLGFLLHNFPLPAVRRGSERAAHSASIFMGDIGSLFLGFTLTSLTVLFTSKPYDLSGFFAPILIIGVPVFDTFLAVLRRVINRRPIVSGDRRHLYDLVRARGLGDRATVLVMYGLALVLGLTGLVVTRVGPLALLLGVAEFVAVLVMAYRLGAFDLTIGAS